MRNPSPVEVVPLKPIACGSALWRMEGFLRVTVVVKATFGMMPNGVARLVAPRPIVAEDQHYGGQPASSVEAAGDLAPFLLNAGVVVTGHAHAPQGRPVQSLTARLSIFREEPLIEKSIHVFGDRAEEGAPPQTFQRMPLRYERAFGGPQVDQNPVGMGAAPRSPPPNLVHPANPREPIGFGPIAASWPARRRLLDIDPSAVAAVLADVPEIGEGFPFGFFQAAPPDQQLAEIAGDEWIVLDGMHPSLPRLQTRLPSARAVARCSLDASGGEAALHEIDLTADTLAIDTDRQTCSLLWRGHVVMAEGEASLSQLRVFAGLSLPGYPMEWPDAATLHALADQRAARTESAPMASVTVQAAPVSAPRAVPPAPVSSPRAVEPPPISSPRAAEPPPVSRPAVDLSFDNPLEGTMDVPREVMEAQSQRPATPFVAGPASAIYTASPPSAPAWPAPLDEEETNDLHRDTLTISRDLLAAQRAVIPFGPAAAPPARMDVPAPSVRMDVPAPPARMDVPAAPARMDVPAPPARMDVPAPPARMDVPAPPALTPPPPKRSLPAPMEEPENPLAGTFTVLRSDLEAKGPALPFLPAVPGKTVPLASPEPASRPAPRAPLEVHDESTSATMALSLDDLEAQAKLPATPFERAPDPIPAETKRIQPPALRDPGEADLAIPVRVTDAIPVFNGAPLVLVAMPWQVRPPRDSLTVIVKGTFAIVPGGPAKMLDEGDLPIGDVHAGDDQQKSVVYPSDFAIFKPRADVVLVGHAVAPGGSSPAAEVRFTFGRAGNRFSRKVAVFGERRWQKSLMTLAPTGPLPFSTMPLRYENAFGGPGFDANPTGTGYKAAAGADGVARLPNLEDPAHLITGPGDKPAPACFGPIDMLWKERWSKLGTYDAAWRKTRYPYLPADLDWSCFQAAPAEQQLEYLTGDEPFEITGVHRDHPALSGKLPGLRARCFAQHAAAAGGALEEVALRLDTAVLDTDAMKLHLVWRGVLEVSDEDALELAAFYVMTDPLDGPATSIEEARARFLAAAHPREPVEESPLGAPEIANDPAPPAEPDEALAMVEAAAEARRALIEERMKRRGIAAPEAPIEPAPPANPEKVAAMLRALGVSEEQVADTLAMLRPPPEPPPAPPEPSLRDRVMAMLAAGEALDGMDLDGADLSGLDFAGRSLANAHLRGASLRGSCFDGSNLAGTLLADADLGDASLDGANLEQADLTRADLTGASLRGALLAAADLSEARGERAGFQGAKGAHAVFEGASLAGARFDGADLPGADFARAVLDKAIFVGAILTDVMLYDARGADVSFEEANLTDARADGVELPRAAFRKVVAPGSIWEKAKLDDASFIGAVLAGASFTKTSCLRTSFSGADLTEAALRRAKLVEARFFKANLHQATLERADLTRADLRGANLHACETWKAKLDGADLDYAIVTKTKLER